MKLVSLIIFTTGFFLMGITDSQTDVSKVKSTAQADDDTYANLSVELITAIKNDSSYKSIVDSLANVPVEVLDKSLDTEGEKKAFWLNVYNAYVQILLKEKPERLKSRNETFGYNFFSSDQVTIAGKKLSFDDIEHGIIRRSKIKQSLGFLDKIGWFTDNFEKRMRWDTLDPRIHFALNCGAESCPLIAVYHPDLVNKQLDTTAEQFLKSSTEYNKEKNQVAVTPLFSWYRGDFGGKDGIVPFLKKYEVIPEEAHPSVSFNDYSWKVALGKYKKL